jgi:hypothetical protein
MRSQKLEHPLMVNTVLTCITVKLQLLEKRNFVSTMMKLWVFDQMTSGTQDALVCNAP